MPRPAHEAFLPRASCQGSHTCISGPEGLGAPLLLPALTLSACPTSHPQWEVPGLCGTCSPAPCAALDETEVGWGLEEGTWAQCTPTPYNTEGWLVITYKGLQISCQTYQPALPAAGV